ncbi:MAG: biotin/lipoyl-containing protein, partial [Parasphingopyxis sp.]|uniref:biotin/lipoyl-containing protein n=1 Tax=Parasphingopyxis sp. TaxID=1920299 RepID=UPI003FA17943
MAKYKFKLPDIGEGIAEAEIVAWHVKVGDEIEEDQGIADMMTDKATVEMESPVSGTVVELNGEEGEMLAIGSVLAVIETDDIPDEDDEAAIAEKVKAQAEDDAAKVEAAEDEPEA